MNKTILTIAVTLALSACSGNAPTPTGVAEKDAKAISEYTMNRIENCSSLEDLQKFNDENTRVLQEFEKYAENHPAYKQKLMQEIIKEAPKSQEAMEKKMQEIIIEKK